jgi:hypothetical protein
VALLPDFTSAFGAGADAHSGFVVRRWRERMVQRAHLAPRAPVSNPSPGRYWCLPCLNMQASDVHCTQDGSWEGTPTCAPAPTTVAATTTAAPNRAWNYWRVLNAGRTTWVPVVSEFMLFPTGLNGKCGGKRITEFNAASEDAVTFLCSGSHRDTHAIMGCHYAFDGEGSVKNAAGDPLSWRPQCGSDNGGCQVKEAWIWGAFSLANLCRVHASARL